MDLKLFFGVGSAVIVSVSAVVYIRDIFQRKTEPHAYTWLIWSITQGTAAAGVLHGGGGVVGAIGIITASLVNVFGFVLSLRYGTKNITKSDKIVLAAALAAIGVWFFLDQPLLAVLMVSFIDIIGFIPSIRKSYQEPWTETISSWIGFTMGNVFGILALREYNLLTVSYLAATIIPNLVLILVCFFRRRLVPRPKKISEPPGEKGNKRKRYS